MVVECEWQEKNTILINPNGQVLPCCYLDNFYFRAQQLMKIDKSFEERSNKLNHNVMRSYHENREQYNLFENDMGDIVNREWFTETLPESFKSEDTAHPICLKMCGKNKDKTQ